MKRVLVPVVEGCEELETVTLLDVFRRAGWEVVAAGFAKGPVTCSRGVRLLPDALWDDLDLRSFDILAIPGGARGTANLRANPAVARAAHDVHAEGKIVAAVCAGPLVLQDAGLLRGRHATCHPGVAPEFHDAIREDRAVVTDGRIVTSQGAGTTLAFALAVIELAEGPARAAEVARGLVVK